MRTRLLLLTEHGSHLYNTASENSDRDFYEIYSFPWQRYRPKKLVGQSIQKDIDKTTIELSRFKDLVRKGVPQSIESLFAKKDHWIQYDPVWEVIRIELFQEVRQQLPQILSTYKRTAWNFHEKENFKKNRHALRLCLNGLDLKSNGYFDPSLHPVVVVEITALAKLPWETRLENFKTLFYEVFGDIE